MNTLILYILLSVNFHLIDSSSTFDPNILLVGPPTIDWPEDFMICVMDTSQLADLIDPDNLLYPYDRPVVTGPCTLGLNYGTAWEDTAYDFNLCTKIFREWTVIDWCNYNPPKPGGVYHHTQIIKVIIKNAPIKPCD